MKPFNKILLIIVGCFLISNVAVAHNSLTDSRPADTAILNESPESVELTFSDATYLESVVLVNTNGDEQALEFDSTITASRQFTVPMPKLESGDYRIKWLVIGDDTHEIRGEFTFTVEDKTE